MDKYKAHIVAKGYIQQEGIGYEERFSQVMKFTLVCLLLVIVAHLNLELY